MSFFVKTCFLLLVLSRNDLEGVGGLTNKYVPLISEVHKYYRTSSVFFILSSNDRHAQEYALVHVLCRDFSRQGVLTLMSDFENLDTRIKFYRRKVVRVLVVVVLKTQSDVHEFRKYTEGRRRSHPIWLVIFVGNTNDSICESCNNPVENNFGLQFNTEMLVSCCENRTLKEWWAVRQNQTETADFATLMENGRLSFLVKGGLYARRHDVNGTEMRVGVASNSPLLLDYGNRVAGLLGHLVDELSRVMNFKVIATLREQVYGSWSSRTEKWSGVIGKLARHEADLGVGEFAMTNSRLDVVRFTVPLLLSESRLYIREPGGSGVQWSAYFKAFTWEIWMAIIILVISSAILLTVIKLWGGPIQLSYVLAEHFLQVWGIFCQQGLSEFPPETPVRIAYISIFGSALVVSAAYSASLISFLTVSSVTLPFTTLEGFANDGSYKLIVFRDSADYDLFATSNDPVITKMMFLMKPWKDLPLTLEEGFEQVCRDKVAFYSNEALRKTIEIYLKCKIASIASGRTTSLALTLPADSQYKGVFDYHLHRFRDNGMLYRLKQQHFIRSNPAESSHHSVTLWGIAPILSALSGGIILAFVIFFLEKILHTVAIRVGGSNQRGSSRASKIHHRFNARGMEQTFAQRRLLVDS